MKRNTAIVHGKMIGVVIWIIAALVSMTILSEILSSSDIYSGVIEVIDDQKNDALVLNATVTAISTSLTLLPDDTGSPVASEIASLTDALFLSICVLYIMKFMMTTFGWLASVAVIPAACVAMAIYSVIKKEACRAIAKKLMLLAIMLVLIIPVSVKVTAMTEEIFSESIQQTMNRANQLSEEVKDLDETDSNAFIEFFAGMKDGISSLVDKAKNMLGILTDAVAVLMITSCFIPLLTAVIFVWILNAIFNTHIPMRNITKLPDKKKIDKIEQDQLVA